MLYLFCNFDFGLPFLSEAKKYCANNNIKLRIVLSGKRGSPSNTFLGMVKKTIYPIKDVLYGVALSWKHKVNIVIVADVNSHIFYKNIGQRDHGVVAGFDQIFKEKAICAFGSLVNFHPSVLPLYRGPMPTYWCLENKEKKSGYTLHRITKNIDKGEILFQEVMDISSFEDLMTLNRAIADRACKILGNYLAYVFFGDRFETRQLDAFEIYRTHIGYLSFPDKSFKK